MSTKLNFTGLTDSEVIASRHKHGINVLTPAEKESPWKLFFGKFRDPLIIILLIAGLLSVGISFYEYFLAGGGLKSFFEPIGIFIAVFLATGLSFFFERKANREFDILNQVNDDEPVEVIRNGNVTRVPRRDVVVGDIVVLNAGDEVPADGQLLEAVSLNVDESTLTGEPMAHKTTKVEEFDTEATYASDTVLRGTKIMEGHGIFRVTNVGDNTENGKVFQSVRLTNDVVTPLDQQLERLGKLITKISYSIAAIIIIARVIMYFVNYDFEWLTFVSHMLQSVMIAIALIVVSVPEGLPMAVTLTLAYSMRRMLKANSLVRKMHVCETMGAATVICTDKTGTLTQNRMQVADARFYGVETLDKSPIGQIIAYDIAVNSTAQLDMSDSKKPQVVGNPTEGALLLWLRLQGTDYRQLRQKAEVLGEIPFSTERKYMATLAHIDGRNLLLVKGAPEIIYSLSASVPPEAGRREFEQLLSKYQNQAMRTLGFAYAEIPSFVIDSVRLTDNTDISQFSLEFLGVVAISDPVRTDVPDAVDEVLNAGIKIKIVTGDTPGTAKEIGRQIGLWDHAADSDRNIITGPEFAALSDSEVLDRAQDLKIIARARPMDKKRLVEALQKLDEVVAVTGDGTNDAPALKSAHVGLSMGDGTSVAKEASDITIIDNSFSSIGRAVMWGRSLYLNMRRFILFQMTVNVVACLIVMIGSFIGIQSPLTVTQMLWVNLIMDTFAAMALASLPPSSDVMKDQPRRRTDFIISRHMWRDITGIGLAFFLILFAILWIFEHYDVSSMSQLFAFIPQPQGQPSLTPYELSLFFTLFVFLQFWNMFNAKAFMSNESALDLRSCGEFKIIALTILLGQVLIVSVGGGFFNVVPLRLTDWIWIIMATSLVLWVGELIRGLRRRIP